MDDMATQLARLRDAVRQFMEEAVLPQIGYFEEASILPLEMFREMGRRGFLRAHVDAAHGGLGLGTTAFCLVAEELSRGGAGMIHPGHFQTLRMILEQGSPAQRDRYLERLLDGSCLAATAITEPEVGSSFSRMATSAAATAGGYVLDGLKTLINDAAEADLLNVFAALPEGISVFLVDRGTPGLRITAKQDPLGMRSSPVYEFTLTDCRLGPAALLGPPGGGLQTFFAAFNFSRLGNASAALGIAQAALDKTVAYLRQRQVGSRPAAQFQGLRWRLAELSTALKAARLLRDDTARLADLQADIGLEVSQTKLHCVELANRVVGECIQATGRYGCLQESLFPLYLRDARVLGTAGGSLEVMKNNIARHLLGNP
jgi:butyryl-CoA dehydrogenase